MKKLFFILPFLFIATVMAQESIIREIPRYHYYDVPNVITTYETKTISVKVWEVGGIKFEVIGDTIVLSSDTFTLTIRKTIKPGMVVPVVIEE